MSAARWQAARWLAVLLASAAAQAQQGVPHIGYVYPAGARQGESVEVTVGGQSLDGVNAAYVSGAGVQARVLEHTRPVTVAQFNKLRDQLKELLDKKPASPEDAKSIAEIKQKLATFVRRPATPAIAEQVRLQVTVAPGATLGTRELRLSTARGLTNPVRFSVSQLKEFSKPPAKVVDELRLGLAARFRWAAVAKPPEAPLSITLPAVVNGQIGPGGVDRYRFQARKGEDLVVVASARELVPYISDAVPGWFQATLTLSDAAGKELGYVDDFRFHPDPVLHYEIPADGEYVLAIRDAIYRGREDFVYRITIGELPFITSIFPLGGKAGAKTTVELRGWNLPVTRMKPETRGQAPAVLALSVRRGEWLSNRVPFAVDALSDRLEREPNNHPQNAQAVKLPLIVNGRIDAPGDQDVFRFDGRAGQEIVAEVWARRLESPLDSVLRLTDAAGREIAANDDAEDKGAGLLTHQADSRIQVRLPAKGTYYLHLGDAQRKGGAEYAYRIRIGPPRPDFELRLAPSSLTVRGGMSAAFTVYALRRDGFAGEIALRLRDAPRGFALSGGWIPAGQEKVRLTLTAPPARLDEPVKLRLEGYARIQGREVCRPGVPSEDMMQAFAYHHLVPAEDWLVRVTPPGRVRSLWKLADDTPVKLPAGSAAPVRVAVPRGRWASRVHFELNGPPEGIAIERLAPDPDGLAIVLRADAGKVKPGLKGNLIVEAFTEGVPNPQASQQKAAPRRVRLGTLPAVPFEIVEAGPHKAIQNARVTR